MQDFLKFKKDQKVRIKKDISLTKKYYTLDENGIMQGMADEKTAYTISDVSYDGKRVFIKGYVWRPEDLMEDKDYEPLPLKKTNILFDPSELV